MEGEGREGGGELVLGEREGRCWGRGSPPLAYAQSGGRVISRTKIVDLRLGRSALPPWIRKVHCCENLWRPREKLWRRAKSCRAYLFENFLGFRFRSRHGLGSCVGRSAFPPFGRLTAAKIYGDLAKNCGDAP